MDKISDPSKYIMAVLRNTMTESTISSPLTTNFNAIKKNGQEHGIIEEDSDLVQKPHTSKKRMLTSKFATETTKTTEVPANHHLVRRQTLGAHDAHEMKGVVTADPERVTMDYVEKCLSCIAKLERPIIQLSGVGPKTEAAFHSLGIFTLRDVLWHFPRYFIDRSRIQKSIQNVVEGNVGTFLLSVGEPKYNTVTCTDEDGNEVDVTYFYGRSRQGMVAASAAIRKLCNKDSNVMIVSGRITNTEAGRLVIFNPDIVVSPDKADSLGIEAVYSLASGLSQQKVSTAVKEALVVACELLKLLPESLPEELLAKLHWPKLVDALMLSHKPTSMEETGFNSTVRQRIVFEELSMQQTRLALTRWNLKHFGVTPNLQRKRVHSCWKDSPLVSAAVSALPFNLNSYQMKCLDELWNDAIVGNDEKMLRLLQGDVGSGKTVLAYLLGLGCIEACQGGGQIVALMCPTQLLASQHVQTISEYACRMQGSSDWNIRVELLTGNVVGKTREDLLARLEASTDKSAVFLVGTHALTTPDIVSRLMQLSSGLALAVVDEEQRFGVRQRLALTKCAAHSLFMSATPIPRSISLKRSAMVDFTVLESDPRIVTTTITSSEKLESVLSVLGTKIQEGSKCFWVLPRIVRSEDSDGGDGDSISRPTVIERYSMLKNRFGEERVCHVHGKMAEHEREEQIARFADPSSGAAILVGTTVIEGESLSSFLTWLLLSNLSLTHFSFVSKVGIDIPDTNILIVEDADRFGLSQLHQLRGRIGRAGSRLDLKCNCILLSNVTAASQSPASLTRLQILQKTNKGEEIADADFYLRGPGDMLGQLQSGIKKGRVVDLVNHWDLLDAATQFGRRFIELPSEQLRQVSAMEDASHTIMTWLAERNAAISHLNTNAASKQGLALRIMMALFAEGRSVEGNSIEVINTLQNLDASKGEQTHDDETIHAKIVEAFFNERNDLKSLDPIPNDLGTQSNMEDPVRPPKPYLAALNTQVMKYL
jgi:ATP-dependent DNA helicase RecG